MHRKPWDELSDSEKKDELAIRLGIKAMEPNWSEWSRAPFTAGVMRKTYNSMIKDWHKDNGLAFKEVWPKIAEHCNLPSLGYDESDIGEDNENMVPVMRVYSDRYAADTGHVIGESYVSWADAICKAAYTLIPVPESKEIGATK